MKAVSIFRLCEGKLIATTIWEISLRTDADRPMPAFTVDMETLLIATVELQRIRYHSRIADRCDSPHSRWQTV
jgi:hypothetical protein